MQPIIVDEGAIRIAESYRRRKVTSVLAVMFTDIAGSTELREKLGEVAYENHREHHEGAVRDLIEKGGAGAVVKNTGDGAMAVFSEPSEAVTTALKIQAQTSEGILRLRIGIDMGQVSLESRGGIVADVFGRQVNRAARIQGLAQPTHVLTSFHVYDCAVGWLAGTEVKWHNHGKASIKGFSEAISIHEPYYPEHISPQVTESTVKVDELPVYDRVRHTPDVTPVDWAPGDDPMQYYAEAIAAASAQLLHPSWLPPKFHPWHVPAVLWVDDFPDNNLLEREILTRAGCRVDLAQTTLDATLKLKSTPYTAVISDMGRGDNPVAGLELLEWMKQQPRQRSLALIYCSTRALGLYKTEALKRGALLCTAGMISLLDGILQIMRYRHWAGEAWR
jgi:class 3 adenylate cyclase/CheY-like chemotaxis protein